MLLYQKSNIKQSKCSILITFLYSKQTFCYNYYLIFLGIDIYNIKNPISEFINIKNGPFKNGGFNLKNGGF